MMDQARQSRQILLFQPDFIKNQNQIGCFLTGSNLPARLVWIDTIFLSFFSFFVALSRRFFLYYFRLFETIYQRDLVWMDTQGCFSTLE